MWLIIFGLVMAAMALGTVYAIVCVGRFGIYKKLSGGKKWLKHLFSFITIVLVFTVLVFTMSSVNAVIVFLDTIVFFLIFGLIMRIIKRASGKDLAVYWQGWLTIAASVVYHIIGYYLCFNIWQTDYSLVTDKHANLRIALFADSHLGTTFDGEGFAEQMKRIEEQSPDIVLIAGDFVDDSSNRDDLIRACEALGKMNVKYGVWYCYGNHDEGYFNSRDFTAEELEAALTENGIHVLADECELVDNSFYVVGRKNGGDNDRKDMAELLEGADTSKYIIVMDHIPNDYDEEAASAADLVVSGHTHGGQLFPITYVGEWFDINDATYGYERRNDTDFVVTSGISDWEIYFKTATKSEYVIIDVSQKK